MIAGKPSSSICISNLDLMSLHNCQDRENQDPKLNRDQKFNIRNHNLHPHYHHYDCQPLPPNLKQQICNRTPRTRPSRQDRWLLAAAHTWMAVVMLLVLTCHDVIAGQLGDVQHSRSANQASLAEPDSESDLVQRIVVGRPVKFKCVVNEIGSNKVSWVHKDKRILLAVDNKPVAWKDRIAVSSQANTVFYLQIDNVQLTDKGNYSCQLSTKPMQSQVHILDVVKPPRIIEELTTISPQPVREFSAVELRCVADAVPKAEIRWRRDSQSHHMPTYDEGSEQTHSLQTDQPASSATQFVSMSTLDGNKLDSIDTNQPSATTEAPLVAKPATNDSVTRADVSEQQQQPLGSDQPASVSGSISPSASTSPSSKETQQLANGFIGYGEVLRFERVTRNDMGFYICIASNGVQPIVSQRIFLPVSFALPTTKSAIGGNQPTVLPLLNNNINPHKRLRPLELANSRANRKHGPSSHLSSSNSSQLAAGDSGARWAPFGLGLGLVSSGLLVLVAVAIGLIAVILFYTGVLNFKGSSSKQSSSNGKH